MVMGSYAQIEIKHGDYRQASAEQVGLVEGADVGNVSAGKHTDAYAYIPRCEVGGSGGASLVVGGQIDKQGVVGGKHDAESDAQSQCYEEE